MSSEKEDRAPCASAGSRRLGQDSERTGLGLSPARSVAHEHAGAVTKEDDAGRGTTFSLPLPAADAVAAEELRSGTAAIRSGHETILMVEDESSVRCLIVQIAEAAGYRVLQASSGACALAAADACDGPIDLLVTDIMMAGMSGIELGEKLLERRPGVSILYMSGYPPEGVPQPGRPLPGSRFLRKPFGERALLDQIRQALDGD